MKYILLCIIIVVLSGCSPKVFVARTQYYPPLGLLDSIYTLTAEDIAPKNAELIGSIDITDRSYSAQSRFREIIRQAKEETRKMGGNILHITEHIRPGINGKSHHQLSGNILRISSPELTITKTPVKNQKNPTIDNNITTDKKKLPTFDITVNGGYGYAPTINPELSYEMKESKNLMDRGGFWNVIFHNYPDRNFGWGVNYSGFRMHTTSAQGPVNDWDIMPLYTYIAPQISYKLLFSRNGMLRIDAGIGYMRLDYCMHPIGYKAGKLAGNTIGYNALIGIEGRIKKHIGIGLDFHAIYSSFKYNKLKFKDLLYFGPKFSEKDRSKGIILSTTIGIRYYFY